MMGKSLEMLVNPHVKVFGKIKIDSANWSFCDVFDFMVRP